MKHGALVLLFGSCAVLSGCATITNQGNRQMKLEPDRRVGQTVVKGHTVRAEPILVTHLTDDTQIYDGAERLVVHLDLYGDSATYSDRLQPCDQVRAFVGKSDLQIVRWGELCGLAVPSVWLDTHTLHVLRVVQGGREGTVTIQSRTHWWPWVWVDFLLGPAAPVGLLVDALTGKWTYYGGKIDVAAVVATPSHGTR
jgi:hypothetical protein